MLAPRRGDTLYDRSAGSMEADFRFKLQSELPGAGAKACVARAAETRQRRHAVAPKSAKKVGVQRKAKQADTGAKDNLMQDKPQARGFEPV